MKTWAVVLLVILAILIVAVVVLYFLGRKMQKKQEEQQAEEREKAANATRHINLNELDGLSGLMTEEETLVAKMMAEQGNSVDFTA